MIDVEIQNEDYQTTQRIKMIVVPRIGEGIRLQEPSGSWVSYDVLDVWYQKAEFGDVWVPYLHVRMTPADARTPTGLVHNPHVDRTQNIPIEEFLKRFEGDHDHVPSKLALGLSAGTGL